MRKTILGYDLGIGSVGWALFEEDEEGNPRKIIDLGSFVFDQIEDPKSGKTENIERRVKRSMRRQRRRRALRLEDGRSLFKEYLNVDFLTLKFSSYPSPYELKVKGLTEKLSKEELSIALYHYLKYRGFKSNRKNEAGDADARKMKKYYASVEESLHQEAGNRYISQYLLSQYEKRKEAYANRDIKNESTDSSDDKDAEQERIHIAGGAHIRNKGDDYTLTVTRSMYLDEINALLDKQIEYGVINSSFKDKYIQLFSRQRDFSDGPDESSKYHIKWEDRIKKCAFDGELCAPKDSLSAKRFILLSALCNIRFKTEAGGKYQSLTPEQIVEAENYAIRQKTTKYRQLFSLLKMPLPFRVKGLDLTRKERGEIYRSVCHADENGVINTASLDDDFKKECDKKLYDKTFFTNSDLLVFLFKKMPQPNTSNLNDLSALYDQIASILLTCKTDIKVQEKCKENNYSADLIGKILDCPEANSTINLSLPLCSKLIPYLEKGLTYDEAMEKVGLSHFAKRKSENGIRKMPPIEEALKETGITLRNPVVKHTLVQVIRITNAIIDRYGAPTDYAVELTRDLKRSFQDRKALMNRQLDNQVQNLSLKAEMLEKFPLVFSNIGDTSRSDALLKYKLFKEQDGISPYTNQPILLANLFNSNFYQIDHIIPYSRSFDDSMNNKVLVEAKENQEKKNCTPYEHYHDLSTIKAFLSTHRRIPREKQDKLLAKTFDDDEFLSKDKGDTAYLSRLTRDLLEYYLVDDESHVRTISGGITDKLRKIWHIAGRTHSYISNATYENEYRFKTIDSYRLSSMDTKVDGKNISLEIAFNILGSDKPLLISIAPKKPKDSKKLLSQQEQINNRYILYFINNIAAMRSKFLATPDLNINELTQLAKSTSINATEAIDACEYIWGVRCLNEIQKDINTKIRDNDLHHALDACVIACATPKNVLRITRALECREKNVSSEQLEEENPLPYPGFNKEVLARVYERDEDKLLSILNQLPMYKDCPAAKENVHVLWPTRLPKKAGKGAISADTIYGLEKDGKLTKTVSVDKIVDAKMADTIYNPNEGNDAVIQAVKEWLKNHKETPYPVLKKKGTPIKKVKIVQADTAIGKVDLSNGRFAENVDCVRVAIYRSKDPSDERLYFVPIFQGQIAQKEIGKKNITYTLYWGQGDNQFQVSETELNSKYKLEASINRYSLVEITKTDGAKGLAYSGGVTTGKFEIYSILGDNTDILHNKLYASADDRIRLTVSTIKSIKVRNISALGKIN